MDKYTNEPDEVMNDLNDLSSGDLIHHLLHNPNARVRLSAAIRLMKDLSTPVAIAYRSSLGDTSDMVVQLACAELGHRGGEGNIEALFPVLNHNSWRVRLEACKALITQGITDHRITETIEALSEDPEAAVYDTECDFFQEVIKEYGHGWPDKFWGKLNTILSGPQPC